MHNFRLRFENYKLENRSNESSLLKRILTVLSREFEKNYGEVKEIYILHL